jgi:putative ABC transport system permease protein
MHFGEAISFARQSLKANKLRTGLTMLGMVIGSASIILVLTIALTGRDYILQQIEAVGTNLIYFYYEGVGAESESATLSDDLTLGDLKAAREIAGVGAAAGIVTTRDRVVIEGKEREVSVIGATDDYAKVRNVHILAGRYWDDADRTSFSKTCLLTAELARKLFGSLEIRGKSLKLFQVRFEVIGIFEEGVETFGQSEVTAYSALVPLAVLRRFTNSDKVDLIYASAQTGTMVAPATESIKRMLESRHRKGSSYRVQNMTEILQTADRIAMALTLVLFLIGTITLIISGIGIMNIMLVTVTDRTKEIGIKMAIGARRREIMVQFLTESVILATSGGTIGILLGISGPLIGGMLAGIRIPVSWVAIVIAFFLSVIVGVTFGLIPASRAAKLNPTEALRFE